MQTIPAGTSTTVKGLPACHWTLVLRRKPVHLVQGRPEGGYTDTYELICSDCGDDPDLDFRDVSPWLRRIRGSYAIAAGVTAYNRHVRLYHSRQAGAEPIHDISSSASGRAPERRRAENKRARSR
jgi:hypothetical protein